MRDVEHTGGGKEILVDHIQFLATCCKHPVNSVLD